MISCPSLLNKETKKKKKGERHPKRTPTTIFRHASQSQTADWLLFLCKSQINILADHKARLSPSLWFIADGAKPAIIARRILGFVTPVAELDRQNAWLLNAGRAHSCRRITAIPGRGKDERSSVRSRRSCFPHASFMVHLQVFGIISGVATVTVLDGRISHSPSFFLFCCESSKCCVCLKNVSLGGFGAVYWRKKWDMP